MRLDSASAWGLGAGGGGRGGSGGWGEWSPSDVGCGMSDVGCEGQPEEEDLELDLEEDQEEERPRRMALAARRFSMGVESGESRRDSRAARALARVWSVRSRAARSSRPC